MYISRWEDKNGKWEFFPILNRDIDINVLVIYIQTKPVASALISVFGFSICLFFLYKLFVIFFFYLHFLLSLKIYLELKSVYTNRCRYFTFFFGLSLFFFSRLLYLLYFFFFANSFFFFYGFFFHWRLFCRWILHYSLSFYGQEKITVISFETGFIQRSSYKKKGNKKIAEKIVNLFFFEIRELAFQWYKV